MPQIPKRVALWTCPRSMSSAFYRAIINRPGTKGLSEPFALSYYMSSDRVSTRYQKEATMDGHTYSAIKQECEQEYEGYDAVFLKEIAYYFGHRSEAILPSLPEGFSHSFLIRNPKKAMPSFYKISIDPDVRASGWDYFDPAEAGYKELYQLYQLVKEQQGQTPVIIDADDLLEKPESVLRLYCERVGLPYHDNMMNWSSEPEYMQDFIHEIWQPWYKTLLSTNSFVRTSSHTADQLTLPAEVKEAIDDSMPYYEKMYALRSTVN